jgi:hypothetical protein
MKVSFEIISSGNCLQKAKCGTLDFGGAILLVKIGVRFALDSFAVGPTILQRAFSISDPFPS